MLAENAGDDTRAVRSCTKLIRFTPAELAVVNARARDASQPVACYIRDAAIGTRKRMRSHGVGLGADLIRNLSRVATQLCSLRDVAAVRELPEVSTFGSVVEDVLDLIRRIDG